MLAHGGRAPDPRASVALSVAFSVALLERAQIKDPGDRPRIHPRLEDPVLLDLLRAGRGQAVDEQDPAGRLVVREPGMAEVEQLPGGSGVAFAFGEHDARAHLLLAHLVGNRAAGAPGRAGTR